MEEILVVSASTTSPDAAGAVVAQAIAAAALGVFGFAAAPIAGAAAVAVWLLAAGLTVSIGWLAVGLLAARRRSACHQLAIRVAQAIGAKHGVRVAARRWLVGWPGVPVRVRIWYPVSCVIRDPQALAAITATAGDVFMARYRIDKHVERRGLLVLVVSAATSADDGQPPSVERAHRVVTELLGSSTTFVETHLDEEGEVAGMRVQHGIGTKLVASGYRARVERSLSVMLPGRWRAIWDMEADEATFEVRPSLPDNVWVSPLSALDEDLLAHYEQVAIPFAIDEDGRELSWRPAVSPQAIIVGGTGSGKTSTTHALLVHVAQYGWPIWVADGKAVEFLGYRSWPNVQIVASTIETQVAVIRRAWQVMNQRYDLITRGLAKVADFEPLLVFVDEFADMRGTLTTWYAQIKVKGDPSKPPTLAEVASLIRKGRTARVHVVMATQRPDAEFLTGEMRDNLTMRISVGRLSPAGAQMMWENPAIGVAVPRGKRGRAIAMDDEGRPVEVQCYRAPDPARIETEADAGLLERLRPAQAVHDRLLIVPPSGDADGEERPTFTDYADADWVTAVQRPDLDPEVPSTASAVSTGQELASPMVVLGLTGVHRQETASGTAPDIDSDTGSAAASMSLAMEDEYVTMQVAAGDVRVGDLIEVDHGAWAVVEDDPIADLDPACIVLAWRNDLDETGELSLDATATVAIQREHVDA